MANGKTDKAIQQLFKQSVKLVKLWENASPTSSFAAQSIKTNLSGHDFIGVVFRLNTLMNRQMTTAVAPLSSGQGEITLSQNGSPYMVQYYRPFTLTALSVDFNHGFLGYPSKPEVQNDAVAIPLKIYGAKLIGGGYNLALKIRHFLCRRGCLAW